MGNLSVIASKITLLEIQDGGDRHLGKYTKGHISANSWSICTKFDTMIDMGHISEFRPGGFSPTTAEEGVSDLGGF